jgi:hypothetical protein
MHRYRKSKIDCLRFVMCLLLAPVFQGFFFFSFFAVAINSTDEANKAGSSFKQSILLRCLWLNVSRPNVFRREDVKL